MKSIEEFMLKDHAEIREIVTHIDDNVHDEKEIDERLTKLKFKLEKHFLAEEKAIFINLKDNEQYPIVSSLLIDHEEIMNSLDVMVKEKEKRNLENLQNFLTMLKRHRNKEERLLYSKLDADLDEEIKQRMLERLSKGDKD